jgi:hypothetical protein
VRDSEDVVNANENLVGIGETMLFDAAEQSRIRGEICGEGSAAVRGLPVSA